MMEELDVGQMEGLGAMAGAGVLPGVEKEIKGNGDHIGCGGMDGVGAGLCNEGNMKEDLDWDGLDAVGRGVSLAIDGKLMAKAEVDLAMCIKVGVQGPPDQGTFVQCPVG